MDSGELNQRLSRISTQWTMVFHAHAGGAETVTSAQMLLLERYSSAVYRYLLGAVRDPDVAEELAQEFALRFVRGDFRRADPERGRFRDYLRTALIHLVTDYHRAQQARPRHFESGNFEPASPPPTTADTESEFVSHWRAELLERTWKALAEVQPDYHAILLFRVNNPDVPSSEAARELDATLQKPITAAAVRKAVQRAHERFADLLVKEVEESLEAPGPSDLIDELTTLDVLKYCRSALERRGLLARTKPTCS